MTRRKRPVVATYKAENYPDRILHVQAAVAWRKGKLWRIEYALPCRDCGERHIHGGGEGDLPFMGDGVWVSHCPYAPTFAPLVKLQLILVQEPT